MVEVEARTFLNYSSGVQSRDGTENGDQLASQGIREEGKTSEQQQKKTNRPLFCPFLFCNRIGRGVSFKKPASGAAATSNNLTHYFPIFLSYQSLETLVAPAFYA